MTALILSLAMAVPAPAAFEGWQHCGSLYLLTTPEGADLPATASEAGFPLLVRLDKDWFDFKQPVAWIDALATQFHLDGEAGMVASGAGSGNVLTLKLAAPATARSITYLIDKKWDPNALLYGKDGVAALTFCEVALEPHP